jgi:hypothetical protein
MMQDSAAGKRTATQAEELCRESPGGETLRRDKMRPLIPVPRNAFATRGWGVLTGECLLQSPASSGERDALDDYAAFPASKGNLMSGIQ